MTKNDKSNMAGFALIAVGLGGAALALTSGGSSEDTGGSWGGGGGGFSGGGILDGGGFEGLMNAISQAGDDFMNQNQDPFFPAPEPSLLDGPPIYATTAPTMITSTTPPTQETASGGFWGNLLNAAKSNPVGTATAALFATNPIMGVAAGAGTSAGTWAGQKIVEKYYKNDKPTQPTPTAAPQSGYINVGGGSGGSSGSGGTGSARIVDTRTESGAAAMAGASYIKIHKNQNGKTNGKVTVW